MCFEMNPTTLDEHERRFQTFRHRAENGPGLTDHYSDVRSSMIHRQPRRRDAMLRVFAWGMVAGGVVAWVVGGVCIVYLTKGG